MRAFWEGYTPEYRVFDITGLVYTANLRNPLATIQDSCGRIEIRHPSFGRLNEGDVVRITGIAHLSENLGHGERIEKLELLGKTSVPSAVRVRLENLNEKRDDLKRIITQGTVISCLDDEIDSRYQIVIVKDGAVTIPVYIRRASAITIPRIAGTRIEISGIYCRNIEGMRKYAQPAIVSKATDISALAPPADPFDVPRYRNHALKTQKELAQMNRCRMDGTVLAVWGQNRVMFRTDLNEVSFALLAKGTPLPNCGKAITVSGYPGVDFFNITLEDAVWKDSATAISDNGEAAFDIAPSDILKPDRNGRLNIDILSQGRLVRLCGLLRALPRQDDPNGKTTIDCNGHVLSVICADPSHMAQLVVGSELRVTGRCLLESTKRTSYDIFPQITSLSVITRSPGDIEILSTPPWWTPARLLGVIAALLAALVGIAVWNRFLNRLVQKRGEELSRAEVAKVSSELRVGERTRLAVELHDGLSQNLTGVGMKIKAAQNCGKDDPEAMLRHLAIADRALQSCRNELRNSLWDLRNESLEDEDLNHAIERTLLPHVENVELSVRVNIPRERLTDSTTHAFLKIIRELSLNAIRHGHATAVKVAGALEDGRLSFSVRDNGAGFDPDACPGVTAGHFGIQGIRERLDRFNGQLVYERLPTGGMHATVSMNIPIQENLP